MKNVQMVMFGLVLAVLSLNSLAAQSLKGMSFNGSTGLYSIPTGRVGWERSANFGLDFGYDFIAREQHTAHIPKASITLLRFWEINAAVDMHRPVPENEKDSNTNIIFGTKLQIPTTNRIAIALGANYQILKAGAEDPFVHDNASQVYLATTYAGRLFEWPAETTIVMGYTWLDGNANSDIDFGVGFDLLLLPQVFNNLFHWILDFSNFTYVARPPYQLGVNRGILNTGLRIDFGSIFGAGRFKFAFDLLMTDAFDDNRGFSIGAVFGSGIIR